MNVTLPVTVFLLSLVQVPQVQTGLIPFEENGRFGYRDAAGRVVVRPELIVAQEFLPGGIAAVVDTQGWAYINTAGRIVIRPFVVDNGPDYFSEGLARFRAAGKFGFFDERGTIRIKPRYDFALPFAEGLAGVCFGCKERREDEHTLVKGGRWGFINGKGHLVIPADYEAVESFQEGRARAKLSGRWLRIDAKGKRIED
jgi:hypothetical protein